MSPEIALRLDRLERTNQYLWWGLLATSVAFMFTWGLMPTRGEPAVSAAPGVQQRFDKLVVRELSIVDARGKQVAFLGIVRDRPDDADRVELKLGDETTYTALSAEDGMAHMSVVSGKAQAWLAAAPEYDGEALVVVKTNTSEAGITAAATSGMHVSDGPKNFRLFEVESQPDAGRSNQDARREGSRRMAETFKLYSRILRGDISEADALQRMAEMEEEDANAR